MKGLPKVAMERIRVFDTKHHTGNNTTRLYKYIQPCGQDMEIHVVAVKYHKTKDKLILKDVARSSADSKWIYLRDVAYYQMGGYSVDWSRQGMGNTYGWDYAGKWGKVEYERKSGLWKMSSAIVINPEALTQRKRFKWCYWSPECGDILDYLKLYVKNPKIELLAKDHRSSYFSGKPGFTKQLQGDKQLLRFFMDNIQEIHDKGHTIPEIRMAYKLKCSFKRAKQKIEYRQGFRGYRLPKCIDAEKAMEYIDKQQTFQLHFCEYLRDCQVLGLDLKDTKNVYPKSFKRRRTIIRDQADAVRRQKKVEEQKKMDKDIKKAALKAKKLERIRSKRFKIKVPSSSVEFITEGEKLKNCIGDGHYAAKMARKEVLIAFVRRTSNLKKSFIAVEYDIQQKRVLQCYGKNNSKPDKTVQKFVDRAFSGNFYAKAG